MKAILIQKIATTQSKWVAALCWALCASAQANPANPLHMPCHDTPQGFTTRGMEECLSQHLQTLERTLDLYLTTAQKRLQTDWSDAKRKPPVLRRTQTAWLSYRKAHCDDVYEQWAEGSIRGTMALLCRIDLTQDRLHQVWKDHLTYMDSTPPLLPEPVFK